MTKRFIFLLSFIFLFLSCNLTDESQYDGPEGVDFLLAKDLLPASLEQVAFNRSAETGRNASLIMDQLQLGLSCIPIGSSDPREDIEKMWTNGYYTGSLASLIEMLSLSEIEENHETKAIALILLAHEFEQLTCMFGDIPFSEAIQGEKFLYPKYDLQEEVYQGIIEWLDEAIDLIGETSLITEIEESDFIFNGNMQSWKKFAFGLKARFLFNQRNKLQGNDQEILALINKSFISNDQQATIRYNAALTNPQYDFNFRLDYNISDHLIEILLATNDPRTSQLMINLSEFGDNWTSFDYDDDGFKCHWFSEFANIPILSYTELLFMKTEIAINANSNDAADLLAQAITSSMVDNNVELNTETMEYISEHSNLDDLDMQAKMQRMAGQTLIAYFGNNHLQTWNNYRRTGYPTIDGIMMPTTSFNPSGSFLKRLMYPLSEYEYNLTNVEEALSRQDGALLDTDIWMFKE